MKFTKEMIDKAGKAKTEEEFMDTLKTFSSGELADSELDKVVGGTLPTIPTIPDKSEMTPEEKEKYYYYLELWDYMNGKWAMTEQEGVVCPYCQVHTTMQMIEFLCRCTICRKVFHWKYGYGSPLDAE